ncbi:ABC transporter permease [uncultured Aureimonas sp.]|uniref:ABC transporter permease n=1 Tax=uncultured Aureimonas sp. TaxID=1604662 RepID=UPI0025E8C5AA|nr:ABC transporter permease [uncultured Aureimonas sp.]
MQASYASRKLPGWLPEYRSEIILAVFIALIFAGGPLLSEYFFTPENLFNLSRQASYLSIVAVGMALVLVVGGIDLSVGAIMQLVGLCSVLLLGSGASAWTALLVALVLGSVLGLVNGILTVYVRMQAFIATLATGGIMTGIVMTYTQGNGVAPRGIDRTFRLIGSGNVAGIPNPAIAMILIVVLFWWVTTQTVYGRNIYAVGANKAAAFNIGIRTRIVECSVYVLSGTLAALAGFLTSARSGTFQPATAATGGTPVEIVIMAVAAVVLGGGNLSGGKGTVVGAFLGALVSAIMLNFFVLLGMGIWFQRFVLAMIIIVVVVSARGSGRS